MYQSPKNRQFASIGTEPIIGQILSFMSLPNGWCYGRGRAVSASVAIDAIRIFGMLKKLGFDRFEVFPDMPGGVLLSSFYGDDSIEIVVVGNDKFSYTIERPKCEDETGDEVDESQINYKARELSCQKIENTFDCSTQYIIASRSDASLVLLSRTLTASLWSSHIAPNNQAVVYAGTYPYSIQNYQESPQYIGEFERTNFLREHSLSRSVPQLGMTATSSQLVSQTANMSDGLRRNP